MLHYYPRHVSSINMPIFRRKNCIHTASGIVALCKRLHSTPVESGLPFLIPALHSTILCVITVGTSLVVWWSELLTTNHEVPGWIPGSTIGIFPCRGRIPVVTMV